ncbi:MAG: MFS transporter, partial [Burkholderiaceae bacterium]
GRYHARAAIAMALGGVPAVFVAVYIIKSLPIKALLWLVMVVVAWQATTPLLFWVAAHFAGLAMGASQSGARAAVAYLARPGREAETFGLWGVAVNLSAILGPMTYGWVTWITNNAHRVAMLVTGGFFLIGLLLLLRVDFDRGHRVSRPSLSTAG